MQPRVVFDTNILISAIGWSGNPRRCLEFVKRGFITGLTCIEILDECFKVLTTKLNVSTEEALANIIEFHSIFQMHSISNQLKVILSDPADDKILECAIVGKASHIVTGDKRHLLPLRTYDQIKIVTAEEFLREILTVAEE